MDEILNAHALLVDLMSALCALSIRVRHLSSDHIRSVRAIEPPGFKYTEAIPRGLGSRILGDRPASAGYQATTRITMPLRAHRANAVVQSHRIEGLCRASLPASRRRPWLWRFGCRTASVGVLSSTRAIVFPRRLVRLQPPRKVAEPVGSSHATYPRRS